MAFSKTYGNLRAGYHLSELTKFILDRYRNYFTNIFTQDLLEIVESWDSEEMHVRSYIWNLQRGQMDQLRAYPASGNMSIPGATSK